ncbi:MAG: D-alanine aminotransferase [Chlamydiia bacterium]|nr:D-alanine aminotransferase [Chlamydiia bacterium]
MHKFCFADGKYLPKDQLKVSIDDYGFARGYTLFEHFKTYNGKPFHGEDHLRRLFHAAAYFYLNAPYTVEQILEIIETLHEKNNFREAGYKIYLTAGPCESYLEFPKKPSFYIVPYAIEKRPGKEDDDIFVTTTRFERNFTEHKTAHYLPGIKAHLDAIKSAQVDGSEIPSETLYLDSNDHLLEGTFSSLIVFDKDTLIVPKSGNLPSITQYIVLRIAKDHFEIKHEDIPYDSLCDLTEVLFASSVSEIRSIRKLDTFIFPERKNATILKELFNTYVEKSHWPLLEKFSYEPLATSCL